MPPRRRQSQAGKSSDQEAPSAPILPADDLARPRAAQALRLRRLGYTYEQIAERVGYADESGARRAIKKANASIIRDEARALVGWQLDQIDMALSVVLEAVAKNDKGSLWAVDRLVPLLKRQAELMGLDAPKADPAASMPVRREYVGVAVEEV